MIVTIGKYTAKSDKDRWDLTHTEIRDVKGNDGSIVRKEITNNIGYGYMDMDNVVKTVIKHEVGKSDIITDLRGWLTEYERIKFKAIPILPNPNDTEKF